MKNLYLKIFSLVFSICLLIISVLSVSAVSSEMIGDGKGKYEKQVVGLVKEHYGGIEETYLYEELYEHYTTADEVTLDKTTANYVLIFVASDSLVPSVYESDLFDKYVVYSYSIYTPYSLGCYIYEPENNEIYTLREAWDTSPEKYINIFTDYGLGRQIGDTNWDGKINIQDATLIQKAIATLSVIEYDSYGSKGYGSSSAEGYISDFNRDGERNVKDATAIQKHIVGLPY